MNNSNTKIKTTSTTIASKIKYSGINLNKGEKPVHWKPQNIGKKNKKYK